MASFVVGLCFGSHNLPGTHDHVISIIYGGGVSYSQRPEEGTALLSYLLTLG